MHQPGTNHIKSHSIHDTGQLGSDMDHEKDDGRLSTTSSTHLAIPNRADSDVISVGSV